MQFFWLLLLLPIETPAPLTVSQTGQHTIRLFGDKYAYTIVNKANGWRMFASAKDGRTGCTLGPINHDQMWVFAQQENESYAIVNAANGMRMLAQNIADGERGFFAVADGPIYQDQKWWLTPQMDGSYVIENVKSGRRIQATVGELGQVKFAAVSGRGPDVLSEEAWWIVNQDRDETARYAMELQAEKTKAATLVEENVALRNRSTNLSDQFHRALEVQGTLTDEVATWKNATLSLRSRLQEEQAAVLKLARNVAAGDRDRASLHANLSATRQAKAQLLEEVAHFKRLPRCWMPEVQMDFSRKLLLTVVSILIVGVLTSVGRQHVALWFEVRRNRKQIITLEQEIISEFGSMVKVGDTDCDLGCDFGFRIFDAEINQEAVRLIKIQCPGVKHSDVEVELVFNGCEVVICRQASRGVANKTWKKRFQFRPSDGLFEFREEQMQLEDGYLQLVFRTCAFHNRLVLFPRHFRLSDTDTDACWDYAVTGEVEVDQVEAWWHDDTYEPELDTSMSSIPAAAVERTCSAADVDTESTASSARCLV